MAHRYVTELFKTCMENSTVTVADSNLTWVNMDTKFIKINLSMSRQCLIKTCLRVKCVNYQLIFRIETKTKWRNWSDCKLNQGKEMCARRTWIIQQPVSCIVPRNSIHVSSNLSCWVSGVWGRIHCYKLSLFLQTNNSATWLSYTQNDHTISTFRLLEGISPGYHISMFQSIGWSEQ